MDSVLSIWNMAKRYFAGAIVGMLVAGLAGLGITEATSPETIEQVRVMVDAFLMAVFYIITILFKTWRQKSVLESGNVLPERVESNSTAREHGIAPAGRTL